MKAQDNNSKLQRDIRENLAQKEDQVYNSLFILMFKKCYI